MAKGKTIKIRLYSSAGTGFFYATVKNKLTPKLSLMKYDPFVRQHVLFNESKK